jgi:hypothetical protein
LQVGREVAGAPRTLPADDQRLVADGVVADRVDQERRGADVTAGAPSGAGGQGGRRVVDGEGGFPADDVGLDAEVEVDADLLEEVVVDGDEPDLDGDLQVLEPAELPQQVDDLVVDLGPSGG